MDHGKRIGNAQEEVKTYFVLDIIMNARIIVFLGLLTFAFLGCNDSTQQPTSNNDQNNAQQNETPSNGTASQNATVAEVEASEQRESVFGDKFPEVLAAKATSIGDVDWRFSVTLSSPYDTPQRYADAWRVLDGEGNELGIRVLGHDHASEQPFTRSGPVQIPNDIKTVFVEGRDKTNGWSGQRFELALPEVP